MSGDKDQEARSVEEDENKGPSLKENMPRPSAETYGKGRRPESSIVKKKERGRDLT